MSDGSASPKRPRFDFDESSKDDHHEKYSKNRDQDDQESYSTSRKRRGDTDEDDIKECEDVKSKSTSLDATRREHTLVVRLTNKEQELQDCMNQIQEMKQAQTQNTAQLRSMLLDPAINLVFQRMSKEMDEHKEKLKQKQNELNAWKFTADSQTGMRLMGKCRMLLQENGELGKMISSGRTARLEGEISLHKALVGEMKKNQKELDEFVGELEEDVEGMQGMIFMLQQQLKEAREQITRLQQENEQLRTLQLPTEPDPGGLVNNELNACDENGHLSSSSPLVNSSYSTTDHVSQLKPSKDMLPVDNVLIPPVRESTLAAGCTDEFNSGSFSLKVTPDSGIQTQEEDDDASAYTTDSPSIDEFSRLNSEDCQNSCVDLEPHSTAKIPDNHLEDGLRTSNTNILEKSENGGEILQTLGPTEDDPPAHHPVPKSIVHERTSPITTILTNSNGDTQLPEQEDFSESSADDRTQSSEVKGYSKDRTEDNDLDLKLTNSSGDCNVDDTKKVLVGLEQEKCSLVNGSSEEVTSSVMDTN